MRWFLFFSLLFLASFFSHRIGEGKKLLKEPPPLFEPAPYALKNRSFCVVVTAHNNGATLAKTIASITSQNYEPFRFIYVDDGSTDGSFDLARDLICESRMPITLVRNEEKLGDLANIVRAVESCEEEEIVVLLRGEDVLAHEWVLQNLNLYYENPNLWLTCSQYRFFPSFEKGTSPASFPSPHLKSFYASLFRKIRDVDLRIGGKFFPACAEMAYMVPLMQLAKDHFYWLPDIHTLANQEAIFKEDPEWVERCSRQIAASSLYEPLNRLKRQACGD